MSVTRIGHRKGMRVPIGSSRDDGSGRAVWCAPTIKIPASAAYLDPGTGSYLLQLLIAGVLGGAFTIKMYWTNLKTALRGMFSRNRKDDE